MAAAAQTITVNGEAPPNVVTLGAATGVAIAVSDGPGNATDWIAFHDGGAAGMQDMYSGADLRLLDRKLRSALFAKLRKGRAGV